MARKARLKKASPWATRSCVWCFLPRDGQGILSLVDVDGIPSTKYVYRHDMMMPVGYIETGMEEGIKKLTMTPLSQAKIASS